MQNAAVVAGPASVPAIARWTLPTILGIALVVILWTVIARSPVFLSDGDTGWHIRAGDFIRQTGAAPRHDIFSYTMAGRDWFAWEWLTDVLMSVIHSRSGLAGLTRATVVTLFVAYALLLRTMAARGDVVVASALAIFGATMSMVHWFARPHVLSILLLLVWCIVVERWRRDRFTGRMGSKIIYGLPLLIALWANLHGAFVVTFPMLVIYAAGEWLEFGGTQNVHSIVKTYLAVGAASAAASLATPYGVHLYGHLWQYLTDTQLLATVDEFQSPDFHTAAGKLIELFLLLVAVACARAISRRRFVDTGLLLFWGHMSLQSVRHVPLAVVVVMPILAEHWTGLLRDAANWFDSNPLVASIRKGHRDFTAIDCQLNGGLIYAGIVVFLVVLVTGASPSLNESIRARFDETRFPIGAANYIANSPPAGRGYAPDQFGGYLIYRFYPEMKVFIDGRSDFYRTGPVVDDYLRISSVKPDWATLLDKYDVRWMVLRPDAALGSAAKATRLWTTAYEDKTAVLLIRR